MHIQKRTKNSYPVKLANQQLTNGLCDPQRFAEVILEQAAGWTPDDVAEQLKKRGTYQVDLNKPIRVHNVYFTLVADKDGTVQSLKDVYAHDKRVADALNGKSLKKIAARDPIAAVMASAFSRKTAFSVRVG